MVIRITYLGGDTEDILLTYDETYDLPLNFDEIQFLLSYDGYLNDSNGDEQMVTYDYTYITVDSGSDTFELDSTNDIITSGELTSYTYSYETYNIYASDAPQIKNNNIYVQKGTNYFNIKSTYAVDTQLSIKYYSIINGIVSNNIETTTILKNNSSSSTNIPSNSNNDIIIQSITPKSDSKYNYTFTENNLRSVILMPIGSADAEIQIGDCQIHYTTAKYGHEYSPLDIMISKNLYTLLPDDAVIKYINVDVTNNTYNHSYEVELKLEEGDILLYSIHLEPEESASLESSREINSSVNYILNAYQND